MPSDIDPLVFQHVQPYLEQGIPILEKSTADTLKQLRAYLANPREDVTGLRLFTLVDRVGVLKRDWKQVEDLLKRLQGAHDGTQ